MGPTVCASLETTLKAGVHCGPATRQAHILLPELGMLTLTDEDTEGQGQGD